MSAATIDTSQWLTLSEAARILGVTHQRVFTMAEEGSLDIIRPWPRVALVSRQSVTAWLQGERLHRTDIGQAREWLRERGVDPHREAAVQTEGEMLAFIHHYRPRWDDARQREWAQRMTHRLITSGS